MESTTELKNQRALIILLGLALVGSIIYFGIIPLIKSIQEEKIDYLKLQYSIDQEKKILGDLRDLIGEYKKYEASTFKKLNKILPNNIDQSIILVQLDALAFSNGASLQSLNFGTPTQVSVASLGGGQQVINSIPINVSVVGNYLSVKNFLNALYKNLRLLEIDSANFQSPEKTEKGEILYTVNISLRAFYKGRVGEVGSEATSVPQSVE